MLFTVALTPAMAQAQPFPTFKGTNARIGNNGAPSTTFHSYGNLGWFSPSLTLGESRGDAVTIDNTDTGSVAFTSNWVAPTAGNEASSSYMPTSSSEPYRYAMAVAASLTDNTTVTSGTPETATFTLTPPSATARDFAVLVHFPNGTTTTASSTKVYQANYAVVKVTSANGTYIDVVNVEAYGNGWTRIGNGGATTAKLFSYDGVNPLKVTIYNTVPRDSSGNLLDTRTISTLAVYADAVRLASDLGSYSTSPTVFQLGATDARVVSALNSVGQDSTGATLTQGTVYCRDYAAGTLRWKWSPQSASLGTTVDNTNAASFTGFTSSTAATAGSYLGSDFYSATVTSTYASAGAVLYKPTLDDGDYYIYMHTVEGGTFAQHAQVEISEDGGLTFSQVEVDQTASGPWILIGTQRYNSSASSLWVRITNYSASSVDSGKTIYADAIKFEGKNTGAITSTPVQAKVFLRTSTASVPVLTNVVLVATEEGKLYCLDATGNGDGTTNLYWTYPSSTSSDPNQVSGKDGVGPLNIVPTNFNLSSALIQSIKPPAYSSSVSYHLEDWVSEGGSYYISMVEPNVGVDPSGDSSHTHWAPVTDPSDSTHAQDRLYIGASNGRVYCIDMTGRGDYSTSVAGTTNRVWTYPDDYPSTLVSSSLGSFKASLAYSAATDHAGNSVGTIYACTEQGRVYALDAVGDPQNRVTTVHWTYPSLTSTQLGAITTTPAVAFGNLYLGTAMRDSGSLPGQFLCIKTDSTSGTTDDWGTLVWSFSGDTAASADNFMGGPAIGSATDLNAPFASSMPDTVFVSNQNRYVYAFNAATGAVLWETKETAAGIQSPLTFTYLTVPYYDTVSAGFVATATPVPVVMVPTENGHLVALYGNTQCVNRANNGTRRAWEYDLLGDTISGVASGYNWMYANDQAGYLYAFNATAGSFTGETPPGGQVVTENDDSYYRYNKAKMKMITAAGYKALRAGTATYSDINSDTYKPGSTGYEYGQTMYMLVYNFPYDVLDKNGNAMTPPIVNFNLSVEGVTLTTNSNESTQISGAPFDTDPLVNHLLDGYAVLSFTIDLAGMNALAPGNGIAQATVTSGYNGTLQPYGLSNKEGEGEVSFNIANPIGLVMSGTGESVGNKTNGADSENNVNGTPTALERIASSTGVVSHGQSGNSTVQVIDRSLMILKRGDGYGLGFVRVQRNDLSWKWPSDGTSTATTPIFNPLPSWASTFEDLPVNQPNTSLDYPDIRRDRVTVTKDPTGTPQNPLFNGVELTPPNNVDESDTNSRELQMTPFSFAVSVPKYQPANTSAFTSATTSVAGGYAGQMVVFVDSTQSGVFDITAPRRTAYRTFYFTTAVAPDYNLKMGASVIDLKSLSGGAGFSTTSPWSGGAPAPWPSTNASAGMYQTMDVYNQGNVNLLDVHLAKGRNVDGTPASTMFGSDSVDPFAWLDSRVHLYSDLDDEFFGTEVQSVLGVSQATPFAVKPRVTDRLPAKMSVNPTSRVTGSALLATADWPAGASPKVTVVVPLGFPAGSYQHTIRVIEDTKTSSDPTGNGLLDVSGSTPLEAYTDPTAILKFKVAETRLTNGFSTYAIPMIDPAVPSTAPNTFKNMQPTGMRTPAGNLVVAWISDRADAGDASYSTSTPSYSPSPAYPSGAILNPEQRLYIAAVSGSTTQAVGSSASPLGDLSNFTPQSANWFAYRNPSDPFPKSSAEAQELFGSDVTSVRIHHPAFPTAGAVSPVDGSTFSQVWLAAVGDARVSAGSISRIILAPVTMGTSGPVLDSSAAGYVDIDDSSLKGKPSIVQLSENLVVVFYSSGGGGQSRLNYMVVDTSAFSPTSTHRFAATAYSIDMPSGFEMTGAPSATYRVGTSTVSYYDVSFVGKLAGRPNTEIFFARMPVDATTHLPSGGITYFPAAGDVLSSSSTLSYETLTNEGKGLYRAKGVGWDPTYAIDLINANTGASLLASGTKRIDEGGGIITYDSVVGGQVYFDTNQGTVRFAGGTVPQTIDLRLSYRAAVRRVSESSTAGQAGVSLVRDNHPISDVSYWKDIASDQAVASGTNVLPDRFVFTYNRAASGAGQAARPYWKSMRFGVQLNHSAAVGSDGTVTISVSGLSAGYYQIDPVKGRVYFADNQGGTSLEGVNVSVQYTALNQADGSSGSVTESHTIGLIDEVDEAAVPIDVPVNETGLSTFFDPIQMNATYGRPTLLWMIWSSARGNGSDLYMQTLAPQFIPTGK